MKRLLFLLLGLLFLAGCSWQMPAKLEENIDGALKVHFIDVGQADSILISKESSAMLIDGGNNDDADKVVKYIMQQGIKKLDYVIGTHPHEDHIGGLDKVIGKFDIGKVLMPKVSANTKTFEDLLQAVKKKELKVTTAKAGLTFELASDVKFEILSPCSEKYEEINNYSAVIKLSYKNSTFLFEGDAEAVAEKEMLKSGSDLKADVLKVGHHGSSSSTSSEFLKAVEPKYAVISVGKANDYNHPHKQTLKKLKNIITYRTDEDGTIVMVSDGDKISVKKEK